MLQDIRYEFVQQQEIRTVTECLRQYESADSTTTQCSLRLYYFAVLLLLSFVDSYLVCEILIYIHIM